MATCPRCLGPLSDGHRCRPIWIKRLRRRVTFGAVGALFGAFIQILVQPGVPVLGFVFGALGFFMLHEALKNE